MQKSKNIRNNLLSATHLRPIVDRAGAATTAAREKDQGKDQDENKHPAPCMAMKILHLA